MKLFFCLCYFFIASSLIAQTANDSLKVFNDSSHYSSKPAHKIITPVTIAAGYTAICFFSYRYLDDEVQEIAMANQNKVAYTAFKTVGYAGLGETNIFITAGTGISALITKNKQLAKATILLVGSHLINDFVTHQFKVSFQRHRPNTGDCFNKFDWREGDKSNMSFVSSHTSNAFVAATAFAICFHDTKWVPIVAYSTASLVGLTRIYDNAHWASDVMGGAAIGFLSVHAMNFIYNRANKRLSFMPEVSSNHFGASFVYTLR